MFYVINKEKLIAYVISVATVFALFITAGALMPKENVIETSAETQNENQTNNLKVDKNTIYSNVTESKMNE